MSVELAVILKATIVLLSAGVLSLAMYRTSASARHVVWAAALFAALAVPVASTLLPSIDLPLLREAAPQVSYSVAPPAVPAGAVDPPEAFEPGVLTIPDTPVVASEMPAAPWSWKTWLTLAWGLGAIVVAAGWFAAVWSLYRLKRQSQAVVDAEWVLLLEDVQHELGVPGIVRLRIADDAVPPMTWGVFRPVILLPATARTWSAARRRLVLAHEMAHIKRNDAVGQLLAQAACSLYWFNPAVWLAVHRLYVERERACDDAVLRLGAPAADYADHLLQIARGMNSRFALSAVAMAHPSQLKSRITAILQSSMRRQRASRAVVAVLLTSIVALALFVAALQVTTLAAMAVPVLFAAPPEAPAWAFAAPPPQASLPPSPPPESLKGPSISGLVVKSGTNEPVSEAGVELIPLTAGAKTIAIAATKDGRFGFENLPVGDYRVAAARPGFVRAEFGQRAASGLARTISVKADQAVRNIRIEIQETGSISGRVLGRNGTPLENVQVQALKYGYKDGRRVLTTLRAVPTNDLGEYRLYWLPPGDYLVMATLLDENIPQFVFEIIPGGIANRALSVPSGEMIRLPNDDASVPFYFPGRTDPGEAEPIAVKAGVNRASVNFNIVGTTTRRVRGVVLNMPASMGDPSDSFAPSPRMRLQSRSQSVASESAPYAFSPIDRVTGVFELRGVLPGVYDVVAGFGNLHGRTTIQVGAADVDGVRVALVPDFEVNAQVTMDSALGATNADLGRLQLRLNPDYTGSAQRQPSGIYQWRGVQSGTSYAVSVAQMPENGYLKSARMGDLDLISNGIRLDRAPGAPVEITIGFGGNVSGTLDMSKVEPGSTALVAIVPGEAQRGRSHLYKSVQMDPAGRFLLTGIAPGDYTLFAWEDIEDGAWMHPDFIKRYDGRGKAIHIDEGSTQTIQLPVIP